MRILVLQTLHYQNAAESISILETQLVSVERATLYRTLQTFEQHDLVHHIDDDTELPSMPYAYRLALQMNNRTPMFISLYFVWFHHLLARYPDSHVTTAE